MPNRTWPFNWRLLIDKKLYNEDYIITENDKVIVCKSTTAICNIELFDPAGFDQVDEINRYNIYNGMGTFMACITISGAGTFFQGTDLICIPPGSMMGFSVFNIYDDETEAFVNSWSITNDTVLVSDIPEQIEVAIVGAATFLVELAQPTTNNANITVDEINDKIITNDTAEYTISSEIRLIDDLPSGDTLNVLVNIFNSLDVSIRQEMKQYSLSGDQTESLFEFHTHLNTGDYIIWEIETLTNFTGKYQIVAIDIIKEIKGFG